MGDTKRRGGDEEGGKSTFQVPFWIRTATHGYTVGCRVALLTGIFTPTSSCKSIETTVCTTIILCNTYSHIRHPPSPHPVQVHACPFRRSFELIGTCQSWLLHRVERYLGASGGRCTRSVSNNSINCSFCTRTWWDRLREQQLGKTSNWVTYMHSGSKTRLNGVQWNKTRLSEARVRPVKEIGSSGKNVVRNEDILHVLS